MMNSRSFEFPIFPHNPRLSERERDKEREHARERERERIEREDSNEGDVLLAVLFSGRFFSRAAPSRIESAAQPRAGVESLA